MKKIMFLFFAITLFAVSAVSAEIIINEQPKDVYNFGDTIILPVKIKSLTDTSGILEMNLLCGEKETNFYKNGISLKAGEEKEVEALAPVIESITGSSEGTCKIKISLLEEYILTEGFKISKLIYVEATVNKENLNPQEELSIKGNASKESGTLLNGFVEINMLKEGVVKLKQTEIISNGEFSSKIKIPETMEAGEYVLTLTTYEKNSQNEISNKGIMNYRIGIFQVPTNLEIFFEKQEINPGETLRVKAILRDQTGEKINSSAVISIKNSNNYILEQKEQETDKFLEYLIEEGEEPGKWKVAAISKKIVNEVDFTINTQEKISIEIINRTIILTNTGNIPYNKTVLVKIGEEPINIETKLKVGETKKYSMLAPDGEYLIKVLSSEGEEIERSVALTGNAIALEEVSDGVITIIRHPLVWIFILIVLIFVAISLFKKQNTGSILSYLKSKRKDSKEKVIFNKNTIVSPRNKVNLSLSIKGENQKSSVVCIRIKNYSEILRVKGSAQETLQKITNMAENANAYTYENGESIFFIFSPMITKKQENEMIAADLAQSTKKVIDDYNRLFKQKIEYGISAEHGEIILKKSEDIVNFASLGNFIVNARKMASVSQGEILIGEKLKEKIQPNTKLERFSSDRGVYYTLKEIRDKEKHQNFLTSFVKRWERDNKPQKESLKKEETNEEKDDIDFETF